MNSSSVPQNGMLSLRLVLCLYSAEKQLPLDLPISPASPVLNCLLSRGRRSIGLIGISATVSPSSSFQLPPWLTADKLSRSLSETISTRVEFAR